MNSQNLNEKISMKANEFLQYFKTIKRNENEEIYTLEENAPSELRRLVREAHGDFLPDDFRYEMQNFPERGHSISSHGIRAIS